MIFDIFIYCLVYISNKKNFISFIKVWFFYDVKSPVGEFMVLPITMTIPSSAFEFSTCFESLYLVATRAMVIDRMNPTNMGSCLYLQDGCTDLETQKYLLYLRISIPCPQVFLEPSC